MWGTSRRKSLGFDLENILVSFDNNELIIMMYWWRPHLQGIGPTAPKPFLLLLVYAEKALGEQLTFFASLMKDRCNKHVIRITTICFCKCTFLTTRHVLTRNCVMFSMTFQLIMWMEMLCSQLKYLSIARTFINIQTMNKGYLAKRLVNKKLKYFFFMLYKHVSQTLHNNVEKVALDVGGSTESVFTGWTC